MTSVPVSDETAKHLQALRQSSSDSNAGTLLLIILYFLLIYLDPRIATEFILGRLSNSQEHVMEFVAGGGVEFLLVNATTVSSSTNSADSLSRFAVRSWYH